MTQVVLSWLPGYYYDGRQLKSTGAAIPPTQHLNPLNGEVRYYVRPLFEDGLKVGLYIRHKGVVDAIKRGDV